MEHHPAPAGVAVGRRVPGRRTGPPGRASARAALDLAVVRFTELGCPSYLAQASRERAGLGAGWTAGAGPVEAGLTPTEWRVAELVAAGCSNREAAAVLFTSTRTVEGHLSSIYRKFNIRSRAQLALRLRGVRSAPADASTGEVR